jgi:excisionase family DNA binding protein
MTERRLLRAGQVARMLDVSPARFYDLARTGAIPVVRMGRQVRVDPDALEEWIRCGGSFSTEQTENRAEAGIGRDSVSEIT